MDFSAFIQQLRDNSDYRGQVQHLRKLPASQAEYAELEHDLAPRVQQILDDAGIDRLWSHQAQAVDLALDGHNVCVVSSTASGKTLCYTLPIAHRLYSHPTSRSLLIFPTKALAQDQLHKLGDFGAQKAFTAETYDGDTPRNQRSRIKKQAHVVLTNPDMLHIGIMPYHHTWSAFFQQLDFVVLDEVHVYRGVFGSHTANIVRRLRRIANHYGADPQFICCSATISNPKELSERLTGLDFKLVDCDGSPRGERLFVMWNPPILEEITGRRRSTNLEAADLVSSLVRHRVRNICFTLSRRQAELILTYVRDQLDDKDLASRIMAYRGGYLPEQRRQIEKKLFSGELLSVASTTALELGVDIGGLDAAVLAGYPGSVASTWQQVGRAGRGKQQALGVLIGRPDGIHQYLMHHPEFILDNTSEKAIIDPHNRFILAGHLLCAAYELAIRDDETELFGDQMEEILQVLAEHRFVTNRGAWYWIDAETYPAAQINIRSTAGQAYDIVARTDKGDDYLLGSVDDASAFRIVHEGAVYLHGGETYVVEELDLDDRTAYVTPADVDYYTLPMGHSDIRVMHSESVKKLPSGARLRMGELEVESAVIGYRKRQQVTDQQLGTYDLDLPPSIYETVGIWIKLSGDDRKLLKQGNYDPMGSIHALEHAMIQLLPVVALCDPHDISGTSNSTHPDLQGPGIFMYDAHPGGVGICETAFDRVDELIQATADTIRNCPCEAGCPACVQVPDCGDGNYPLDKEGAASLAASWLDE